MSKTTINELKVNGQTYVLKDSVQEEPKNSNIKIAILQRGWVMIGRYSEEGDNCALENAYVIRSWGTTKGVGELALNGKQTGTKLDKAGSVTFHKLTVVALINCVEDKWTSELV